MFVLYLRIPDKSPSKFITHEDEVTNLFLFSKKSTYALNYRTRQKPLVFRQV